MNEPIKKLCDILPELSSIYLDFTFTFLQICSFFVKIVRNIIKNSQNLRKYVGQKRRIKKLRKKWNNQKNTLEKVKKKL